MSINSHAFPRNATKEELISELPELQKTWNGGLSFETENVELNIGFSPIGNDYLLEDRHRMKTWSERFLSPENSYYGKKYVSD